MEAAFRADDAGLDRLFAAALGRLSVHDPAPRSLEVAQAGFEVTVSAACFGQLKRHRMATLLPQAYDPRLGVTVPPTVARAGLTDLMRGVLDEGAELFGRLAAVAPAAAPYVLSQAHRRRAVVQMNARELTHFSRLRLDGHAQWDIRALAERMVDVARRHLPRSLCLACGKDMFEAHRAKLWPDV